MYIQSVLDNEVQTVKENKVLKALRQFDIDPLELKLLSSSRNRQVWKVYTSNQKYAFKSISKIDRAKMIIDVSDYLNKNGIKVIQFVSTSDGKRIIEENKQYFLLSHWIDGVTSRYEEDGMIERMSNLLARFHDASHGDRKSVV